MKNNEDNDKMGYQKTEKKLGVKADLKLKFAAMGAWWLAGILFTMLCLRFFSELSYLKQLMIALPVGLVLMLLFYYIILPKVVDGERKFFIDTMKRFNNEGLSLELVEIIDSHLRMTNFSETEMGYYNAYLNLLIIYNLNMFNFPECMRLLDLKNMTQLNSFYNYTSGKQAMVTHHYMRMLTVSQMGDPQMMEYYYGDANRVFYECAGVNKLVDAMIAQARAMREIAHASAAKYMGDEVTAEQHLDTAEQIMQPHANVDDLRQDYCTIIARSAILRGNFEAADKLFDEAYSLARNDFQRESVLREKEYLLNGPNAGRAVTSQAKM